MSETTFGFHWSTFTLFITIATLLVAVTLSTIAWRKSGYRPAVGGLELLRIAIVGLAVFLLNQPEFVEEFQPAEKPTLVVLCDQSLSMDTQDVVLEGSESTPPLTRREATAPLLDPDSWAELTDRIEVVVTPFAVDEESASTDLHAALSGALEMHRNLRAVVLASDGDWNAGPPPVDAARRYRVEKIPVLGVATGSQTRLPDIELLSFDVPTFGVADKSLRIPFTIDSSLPRDHVTNVELIGSDGSKQTKQVRVSAMGRTSDALIWEPTATGNFTLSLNIPSHPSEKILENNRRETPIAIREERLKVLVVDSLPRWEYRYLRNALSRDPGVEVSCLLFHPTLNSVGGGNRDYIDAFPEKLDELSQYDVVFLGDVGMNADQLTEEQCRLLKGLVEQQASGLVFMPGFQGNMLSLEESPLEPLLPVKFDAAQPLGWGSATPSHFALTELGRRSLLTKLADTQDENFEVWENLPGFQWYAPIVRAKAGTDVLAVHQESTNRFGRIPLLVTRTFGAGKVLFMGTDGAWRWRRGVEDKYHYRFWGQVVRWMAYQRNMAEGELMRFYYSPEQPQVRQTMALSANVMEKNGEPLSKGDVTARIIAPSGQTNTIQMTSSGSEWGAFNGVFSPQEPGEHRVVLECKENENRFETTLFVQGATLEQVGKPARPEVIEELSRVTRGRMMDGRDISAIVKAVSDIPDPPSIIRRVQLWSHPLMAAAMLLLLSAFWIGRKVAGFI